MRGRLTLWRCGGASRERRLLHFAKDEGPTLRQSASFPGDGLSLSLVVRAEAAHIVPETALSSCSWPFSTTSAAPLMLRRSELHPRQIGLFGKRRFRENRRRSGLCIPPHTVCRYLAGSCRSWWLASGEPGCKDAPGTAFSSRGEGTPRVLREPYLEESYPVPPQSRLPRFLNASSRLLVLYEEQWNESNEAQWRPTPIGSDLQECLVLSETSAPRWPSRPRSA